ncbi:MAG TPA: hypothetical protein VFB62_03410, partial [Polyangiaceae bacterium]|nr:hypothetical protein [Polyangiaceae bacterium]
MRSSFKTIFAIALATAMQAGCANTDDVDGEGAGAESGVPEGEGICLMNNCKADSDCGGCDDERDRCLVEENRCIA